MNTFKKIAMSCAGLLLVTTSAFAEISQKQAKELLEVTDTYNSVEKLPQTVMDAFVIATKVHKKEITDKQKAKIIAKSESLLDKKELLAQIEKDVAQGLDEDDYTELLAWYNSDLGQKLLKRMKVMSTKEGLQKIHNLDITKEKNLNVSDKRKAILDETYKVLKIEEKQRKEMKVQIDMSMELVEKKSKKENNYNPKMISFIKDMMVKAFDKGIAESKDDAMAYFSQDYSDEELQKQLEFFKSPAYQKFQSSAQGLEQKMKDYGYTVTKYSFLLVEGIEE